MLVLCYETNLHFLHIVKVDYICNNLYDIYLPPQGIQEEENDAEFILTDQNISDTSLRGSQKKTVVTSIDPITVPGSFFENVGVMKTNLENLENIYT